MKLTRKLIPAFAMLLIAAVMMSTASFAWFSMSTEVKATGMTVTAKAPASLEISDAVDGTWDYTATPLSATATNLTPITYYDITTEGNDGWYIPTNKNPINANGKATYDLDDDNIVAGYWEKVNLDYNTGAAGGTTYALVGKLYLRTNAGTSTGSAIKFDAQASVTGTSKLKDGVMVYIWDGSALYDIKTSKNSPDTGWEAPVSGAKELTVVVVYNGESKDPDDKYIIRNDQADNVATSIEITFNVYD